MLVCAVNTPARNSSTTIVVEPELRARELKLNCRPEPELKLGIAALAAATFCLSKNLRNFIEKFIVPMGIVKI